MNDKSLMDVNSLLQFNPKPTESLLKRRTYATILDLLFVSLMARGIFHTYLNFLKTIFYHLSYASQKSSADLFPLFFTTFAATFFGYFVLSYYLGDGQTPGKIIFKLKVVSKDEKLTLSEGFRRTLGYFLCYNFGMILFSIPYFRKDRKGLPDFFSQTVVIASDQQVAPVIQSEIEKEFDQAA